MTRIKAVFIDFYGTLVYEDGEVIKAITKEIFDTGIAESTSEIAAYWWERFQKAFRNAYHDTFQTQRELEYQSLADTIEHFKSTADAKKLSDKMFQYWVNPPIFDEAKQFVEMCPVPLYIVSNIDRADILKAINFHGLKPNAVFTSEDAKSYKPRKELFELALKKAGLKANEVVHIGDSRDSDVYGADSVGIHSIWVNRSGRNVPEGVVAVSNLIQVYDTSFFR